MMEAEGETHEDHTSEREQVLSFDLRTELEAWNESENAKRKKKKAAQASPEIADNQLTVEQQYEKAWEQLQQVRAKVESHRKEHLRLQDEASNIRVETYEYMSYMEKKTSKRQNMIISLNDQNQREIEKIKEEERQLMEEFEKQKDELREKILLKEHQLAATQLELNNLEEYRELQQKQSERITELQGQVAKMQIQHSEAVQQLKAQFLEEKKGFEEESEATIAALSKQAKKEATDCLNKHTENIKKENREMRQELMDLIERTRALHLHKLKLEKQKKELVRELQYNEDVKIIRHSKGKKNIDHGKNNNASSEEEDDRDSLLATPTLAPHLARGRGQKGDAAGAEQRSGMEDSALAARLHITNKSLN